MAEKKVNTTSEEEKKKKKRLFIIFGSILGAGAIAGASVGIYFAVQPKAQAVKVDVPTIEGLTFKNKQAYVGQDYSTEISIDITKTGENRLPDELKSVKSGNRTITNTEYTYNVADNKESADFKIPGKYIEGDIKIDLELVPPGPVVEYVDLSFTSESCNIKDKEGKDVTQVIKGETFEGKISLNHGVEGHLPATLDITMGGQNSLGISDYEFNPYTGEISFIPTGDVEINAEADTYSAIIVHRIVGQETQFEMTLAFSRFGTEGTINWGEGDPQVITQPGMCTHNYVSAQEGDEFFIKLYGFGYIAQISSPGVVSIATFDGFDQGLEGELFVPNNEPLFEKVCVGKNSGFEPSRVELPKLNTIIVHDDNLLADDFDSNLYAIHGQSTPNEYCLNRGSNRTVIPNDKNIISIGNEAFLGSSIKEFNIPASVNDINYNPFMGCRNLEKLTVDPASEYFTSRDKNGKECNMVVSTKTTTHQPVLNRLVTAIKTTTLPNDGTITGINETAYYNLPVEEINIPSSVTKMEIGSVFSCDRLKTINFQSDSQLNELFVDSGDYVHSKDSSVFWNCPLINNLVIPATVTTISMPLFGATNTALTEITVLATTPPTMTDIPIYTGTPPNFESIYVPDGSVNAYKSASGWGIHPDLIKPLSERPTH